MSSIAIITARGGSKRIPKKNIKTFCGKPIISYSIEAAIKSGVFDEVMVSTDSPEIAKVAEEYGASIPFMRSIENSNDYATTADVIAEVLERYNCSFESFCCIYPTAPFVTSERLVQAYNMLVNTGADSVVPVVQFSFPPQRGFIINNNYLSYREPEFALRRSQDIEPMYHDCGQFYFCFTEKFFNNKKLIMDKTLPLVIPETEVQDIDNISDWELAELKYNFLHNGGVM